MAWQQTTAFNLAKMGKTPGMCLQNVRLAYDIPPYYYDAKAAMLANKQAGTLHPISTLPTNVAVPVFVDTASPNEHVEVADHGTFYSDGAKVADPTKQVYFGWGETLNEVRIVKWVNDPTPTPTPTDIKVGDKVTLTKWVAYDGTPLKKTRDYYYVSQISGDRAVLNADAVDGVVYAAVNTKYLVKYNPAQTFKVGDKVTLKNWVAFDGTPLMKTRDFYYISQINGDKAVLRADDAYTGPVYAAVWLTNLIKV